MANGNARGTAGPSFNAAEREITAKPFLASHVPSHRRNSFIAITADAGPVDEGAMGSRDRLIFKFCRLVEGEAEGRFAISALVALVLAALTLSII
jgi:hypothetical protein